VAFDIQSMGTVTVAVHVAWAPQGAMHFYQLVQDKFYDDTVFFRVLPWMAQFGLPVPGHKLKTWGAAGFLDDPLRKSNRRGRLVFNCHGGKANSRATQAFFLTRDKTDLNSRHYVPFAEVVDGMDISLCSIEGNKLQWAGANSPLWIIRKGELLETLPNRQPIGEYPSPKPFLTHEITLEKDDRLYLFSDGFQDQFGGVKGKKYKAKNLKSLLISMSQKPMNEQQGMLDIVFEEWRADLEQIDDVCVLGLKI